MEKCMVVVDKIYFCVHTNQNKIPEKAPISLSRFSKLRDIFSNSCYVPEIDTVEYLRVSFFFARILSGTLLIYGFFPPPPHFFPFVFHRYGSAR
jgi:hypothetical protein